MRDLGIHNGMNGPHTQMGICAPFLFGKSGFQNFMCAGREKSSILCGEKAEKRKGTALFVGRNKTTITLGYSTLSKWVKNSRAAGKANGICFSALVCVLATWKNDAQNESVCEEGNKRLLLVHHGIKRKFLGSQNSPK